MSRNLADINRMLGLPDLPGLTFPAETGGPVGVERAVLGGGVVSAPGSKPDPNERNSVFREFISGALKGALGPVSEFDPVERLLAGREAPEDPSLPQTLARGLGWVAASGVMLTPMLRAGGMVAKGAGLAAKADAFADLGHAGNLVRGAVAGAIDAAFRDAEDPAERIKHIAEEAAMFGIGDVVLPPIMRSISAMMPFGAKTAESSVLEGMIDLPVVNTEEMAEVAGRAVRIAEDMFPAGVGPKATAIRKAALMTSLEKLELAKLAPGRFRVVPGLTRDASDVSTLLNKLDDVSYAVVERRVGKTKTSDVIITRGKELDAQIVSEYERNVAQHGIGFVNGQEIIHNGTKKMIVGAAPKKGNVFVTTAGKEVRPQSVPIGEVNMLSSALWRSGSRDVKDGAAKWSMFVKEFGEFPADGYYKAFDAYAAKAGVEGAEKDALNRYFSLRSLEALEQHDPTLGRVLSKQRMRANKRKSPDALLREMAGQQGFLVGEENVNGQWLIALRDNFEGGKMHFSKPAFAIKYLQNTGRELPDMLPEGLKIPFPYNDLGLQGIGATRPYDAAYLADMKLPFAVSITKDIVPRYAFLRTVQNLLDETFGETSPKVLSLFMNVQSGQVKARLEMQPWIEELTKIRGAGGKLRDEKIPVIRELLETPPGQWTRVFKEHDLSADEISHATDIYKYVEDLFGEYQKQGLIDIGAVEYFTKYFPYVSRMSSSTWKKSVRETFEAAGLKPSEKTIQFVTSMERTAVDPGRWETDPYLLALRYTRAGFHKLNLEDAYIKAHEVVTSLPREGLGETIRGTLKEFLTASYGGAPEAYQAMRVAFDGVFDELGMKEFLGERTMEKLINQFAGLNYGAFMGFRPAVAVRDLMSTLATTLPMIQSPKYVMRGIRFAMSEAGRGAAEAAGAIPPGSMAAAMEDVVNKEAVERYMRRVYETKGSVKAKVGELGVRAARAASELSEIGMGTRGIKIPGTDKTVRVSLYSKVNEFNRAVAYEAQRLKGLDALKRWRGGVTKLDKFNEESGLTIFGEALTNEFHRKLAGEGEERALQWLGVTAANETQWIYQLGAGPSLFTHGVGRLFGMFGTWPTWYASFLARGLSNGTAGQRASFAGWTAAVHTAFASSALWTANTFNLSNWSPLSSLHWAGGPAYDWFTDMTDIISGARPSGQEPATRRQLALSDVGIRDTGQHVPVPGLGYFDPRKGWGLDIKDPARAVWSIFEMTTPGALFYKDLRSMVDQPSAMRMMLRGAGMPLVAGSAWPEISF